MQFTDAVRGNVEPEGTGLEKFIEVLELADETMEGTGVASTPLPAVQQTGESAAAVHPEGVHGSGGDVSRHQEGQLGNSVGVAVGFIVSSRGDTMRDDPTPPCL